jgi:hypothetical protein
VPSVATASAAWQHEERRGNEASTAAEVPKTTGQQAARAGDCGKSPACISSPALGAAGGRRHLGRTGRGARRRNSLKSLRELVMGHAVLETASRGNASKSHGFISSAIRLVARAPVARKIMTRREIFSGCRLRANGIELARSAGMNANSAVRRRLAPQEHRRALVAATGRVAAIGLLVVYLRDIQTLVRHLGLWLVTFEQLIRRVAGCP